MAGATSRDPHLRRFRPKSYADNFKYDLTGLTIGTRPAWEGQVGIDGVRGPRNGAGVGKRAGGA